MGNSVSRIRLGVSSCLLGNPVRFDGGYKHQPFITATLAQYFELAPVCPERAIALGAPRQPLQLVGRPGQARVVGNKDRSLEVTEGAAPMPTWRASITLIPIPWS